MTNLPRRWTGGQPFALALISGTKGSSPQRIGAKALFFADGKITGTLGGGCLEAEVHSRAKKAMKTGEAADIRHGARPRFRLGRRPDLWRQRDGSDFAARGGSGGTLAQTRRR